MSYFFFLKHLELLLNKKKTYNFKAKKKKGDLLEVSFLLSLFPTSLWIFEAQSI